MNNKRLWEMTHCSRAMEEKQIRDQEAKLDTYNAADVAARILRLAELAKFDHIEPDKETIH